MRDNYGCEVVRGLFLKEAGYITTLSNIHQIINFILLMSNHGYELNTPSSAIRHTSAYAYG